MGVKFQTVNLHHSTHWDVLCSLLSGGLLSPAAFSAADLLNPKLKFLNQRGIKCIWFSSQVWTDNRFGPYVLKYQVAELALPTMVSLGKHNGARCFLSAPSVLASWISTSLNLPIVAPDNVDFQRADKGDRIDLLVPWQVPLSYDLYVVTAKTGRGREDECNFARARLLALSLLAGETRFNASLAETKEFGELDAANNLLAKLVGSFDAFDMAAGTSPPPAAASEALQEALECLASVDITAARAAAAKIGNVSAVAASLASLFNSHFGTHFMASEIESAERHAP